MIGLHALSKVSCGLISDCIVENIMKEFELVVRDLPGVSIQAFRLIDNKYVPYQTSRAPLAVSSIHCPHCYHSSVSGSASRQHSQSSAANPSSPHYSTATTSNSLNPSSMLNILLPPYSNTNNSSVNQTSVAATAMDNHQVSENGATLSPAAAAAHAPAAAAAAAAAEVNDAYICFCLVYAYLEGN